MSISGVSFIGSGPKTPKINKENIVVAKASKQLCNSVPTYEVTVPLMTPAEEMKKAKIVIHTDKDYDQSEAVKNKGSKDTNIEGAESLFFPWVCLSQSLSGEEDGEYSFIKFVSNENKMIKSEIFPLKRPDDPEGY